MSLWNTYCKSIDRNAQRSGHVDEGMRQALHDIDEAAHFSFEGDGTDRDRPPFEHETFFAPFEVCAVEYTQPHEAGLIQGATRILTILRRPEGHVTGFGSGETRWGALVCIERPALPGMLHMSRVQLWGPYIPGPNGGGGDWWRRGKVMSELYSRCDVETRTGKLISTWKRDDPASPREKDCLEEEWKVAASLALHAFALLATANSPANWVVRVTDEHARVVKRGGKKKKVKNTRLIVVPDRSLDRVLRQPSGASDFIERAPHRRRAHYRRLLSPRFRLKRGQRVLVRESWVGPKEASHGGEHYEVLTSLPSVEVQTEQSD